MNDEGHILDLLGKASGDPDELILFLETKDEKILWNMYEDEILINLKSKDEFGYKLLKMYKGDERIFKRVNYKSISYPFDLDYSPDNTIE